MNGIPESQKLESAQNVNRHIGTEKKKEIPKGFCQCGCGGKAKNRYIRFHYIPTNKIHGDHLTKLYGLWRNFRYRCKCKTSKDFIHYGIRGITVCEEWEDYINFKKWALFLGYKEGLSIERKNTNGNYDPENCIFTTIKENNRNKTNGYWWFIYGKRFNSSVSAAKFWDVAQATICAWCGLRKNSWSRPHCYVVRKYGTDKM